MTNQTRFGTSSDAARHGEEFMENIGSLTRKDLTNLRKQIRQEIKARRADEKRSAESFKDEMLALIGRIRIVAQHLVNEKLGEDAIVALRVSVKPEMLEDGTTTDNDVVRYYVRTDSGRRFRLGTKEVDESSDE